MIFSFMRVLSRGVAFKGNPEKFVVNRFVEEGENALSSTLVSHCRG